MKSIISTLVALFVCVFLLAGTVNADWAYAFVVYDDKTYIISDSEVRPSEVGSKIGKVTKYSDQEGTYSGNFSNSFPSGTEYYRIEGIHAGEAIAIKHSDGRFIQANYHGEYAGSKHNWLTYGVYLVAGLIVTLERGRRG
ncbi:hypothetical protein [Cohnella kolymensis]|uniref:hypothetical protein n=1 Tax=Cohnella kolymensis TaxID=1590652 RepID=UPI001F20424D|nr:hypothetical protein [Cohnella kolymensis]